MRKVTNVNTMEYIRTIVVVTLLCLCLKYSLRLPFFLFYTSTLACIKLVVTIGTTDLFSDTTRKNNNHGLRMSYKNAHFDQCVGVARNMSSYRML